MFFNMKFNIVRNSMILIVLALFSIESYAYIHTDKRDSSDLDILSLTLDGAIELALDKNLTLLIAQKEIERVDWSRKENWNSLLPSVSANAQYTNNILKPVFFADFFPGGKMEMGSNNSYAVTGALQVPILSIPLFKSIRLSELELKSTLESARESKIELISQVKSSYYGILMLQESLRVLNDSYSNAQETASNIELMYSNGMASEFDMIRSQVSVKNLLPSLTQAKNSLELAKMQIKILLSLPLETSIELKGSIQDFENELSKREQMDYNLSNNSNIRRLKIQQMVLNKNFELIRSQRLPSLSGFANYQLQMQSEDFNLTHPWSNSFAVGFSIQVPIFNKFSIYNKEKQARVAIMQLEHQRELTELNLATSLKNTLNEMERASVQYESDKEAVRQATRGYEIAKVRYSTGAGTLLELNDSELALTSSRLNLTQAIYDYLKAKSEYDKIRGLEY